MTRHKHMNNRIGLILSFKYISKLRKGDVFALDHDGKETNYYTYQGIKDGSFCAQSNTLQNYVFWESDFRIIEVTKLSESE